MWTCSIEGLCVLPCCSKRTNDIIASGGERYKIISQVGGTWEKWLNYDSGLSSKYKKCSYNGEVWHFVVVKPHVSPDPVNGLYRGCKAIYPPEVDGMCKSCNHVLYTS